MGRINVGRVIVGGVVAGIVGDVFGALINGVLLAPQWAEGVKALRRPELSTGQIVQFNLVGLALGIFSIWLYAAIRPRYGAGPKTAVYAGLAVWVAGTLLPNFFFMSAVGLFSANLTIWTTAGGIVAVVIGTLAGAAMYRETPAAL